jgi:hypothetical protein
VIASLDTLLIDDLTDNEDDAFLTARPGALQERSLLVASWSDAATL